MVVEKFYTSPGLSSGHSQSKLTDIRQIVGHDNVKLDTESCIYVDVDNDKGE